MDDDELEVTESVTRGAARALVAMGYAPLREVSLANGRRADLLGIDAHGKLAIVEVKSSRADFTSDRKWHEYLEFCDEFGFAVNAAFPSELLPVAHGLIIADRFQGELVRPLSQQALSAARRKAMLIRLARLGALRLFTLADPEGAGPGY
ncbi:MAG: MmcB family DNA repair protein [Geminicoccaceae bacterium]